MENYRELLRQALNIPADLSAQNLVVGKVTRVDQGAATCTVEPLDGDAEYTAVRLQAGEGKGFVIYPATGSVVIISKLNQHDAVVVMTSEVDTYAIVNTTQSLRDILTAIVDQLLQLKLATNTGATLQVLTAPTIQPIKQQINQLFSA